MDPNLKRKKNKNKRMYKRFLEWNRLLKEATDICRTENKKRKCDEERKRNNKDDDMVEEDAKIDRERKNNDNEVGENEVGDDE